MVDKRQRIMQAMVDVVAEKGLQRATTAEIARKAGVGEGTIYRHFDSKDDLLEHTVTYAGGLIRQSLQSAHTEKASVYNQFVTFCISFLRYGIGNPLLVRFLEQFRNSPQGIAFKKKTLEKVSREPEAKPFFYPLNAILHQALSQQIVKEYPFQILASLVLGQLLFIVKDVTEGLLVLDEEMMGNIAKACWDAIRR